NFSFLLDNSLYSNIDVRDYCAQKEVCVLSQPLCSPDLSPCDYCLFDEIRINIKMGPPVETYTMLAAAIRKIVEEIIDPTQKDTSDVKCQLLGKSILLELLERAKKCVELNGDYVQDYF
ncbi:hypothetical protein X777_13756, partial [Ooceraea biroi]